MKYIRARQPGGVYFFTLVTFNRRQIFRAPEHCALFIQSLEYVNNAHPFNLLAYCLLPDHVHMIWELPEGDMNYPMRMRLVKSFFSRHFKDDNKTNLPASRKSKGELAVWQRRFWEHLIRDEKDLQNHLEYIHYNPVSHGLANSPLSWQYSSFGRFVNEGLYDENWGLNSDMKYLRKIGHE